jgi:hypothetical protein
MIMGSFGRYCIWPKLPAIMKVFQPSGRCRFSA